MSVYWPFPIGARPEGNIVPLVVNDENLSELENVVSLWVTQRQAEEYNENVILRTM
jgi:hypothetical protein